MDKKLLPASHFSARDLGRNVKCIAHVLRGLPPPARWVEFFAGLGFFTELLQHLWPDADCELWDLDPSCARELRRKFPAAKVVQGDSLRGATPRPGDAVVLDYSVVSIRTLVEDTAMLDRVFGSMPAFVTITDSGINKLHLNWTVYGLLEPDARSYFGLYDTLVRERWGYRLTRVARHARAAYLLFQSEGVCNFELTRIGG